MAQKKQRRPRVVPRGRMTVVVCRGGDCGSRLKHPGIDHAAQLPQIRNAAGEKAVVIVSRCLDACERSNVVVLIPDADGENAGASPVWVGEVNDAEVTADIVDVMDGPGDLPDVPVVVELHAFRPTRQSRRELDGEIG